MTSTSAMTIREFFDHLLRRAQTRDLALQLVHAYHQRETRSVRPGEVR
jgi:hypothetical protein